ncbi:MAG: bifunctional 5,10-methylenetetrahydrofolate dehydrogenase/5,10-methenyltetrahydrofolate cyclohydrolase [Anaerococcus vaginalis]|uniref:bifunctional 5,10-methylenetetrahydrofolate dehydrogenase/5,10-methenyltetrahydrofolate cyclohydrolase n=1 Tax=Anaerococcus vaginalis TaxID=33037 RepID=UPI0029148C4F|nr:bifunctional 5,10-methylenetetrahydrofolate dehydrogenase/5,10-methenyltetrahydrofolate cyclohydrolase [Anaerococcus vaginalis]MDU4447902.1 bifunctional 5,10-methylenetetrahydrofolate dehydrogenase/5,10-methenyltetrahydrofolate cyclohydrolase [Anaerococcus vaginalis]MDU6182723.1 bifunctional 5,10-methylenetetrahydrofolate dehydrogenase/5,10-methenyltetrahydrofolate cyclohydrolase [Anaerococcus vaginalis]MDU7432896.1 bifunctional 5,10-methylenetetrahydrofolate dehydrogenase/5,10-methenyltetrah
MKIIKSNIIKNNLIERIKKCNFNKKLLIISQGNNPSVEQYKNSIIKRCKEFKIDYLDKNFSIYEDQNSILNYCNSLDDIDGFIILQPLSNCTDLSILRENMPFFDLDGFTYKSLGKIMNKDFTNLPQTAKSCIKFLEYLDINLSGLDIVIANSNNIIGKPLFNYLNAKKSTVTIFNSKTKNQKEKIKNCDIFISAIGKANFYNKDYFRDGQILIDVGVSFVDGKMYGDIDYDSINEMDLKVVTCKNGVGSITTLSLLESLLYS